MSRDVHVDALKLLTVRGVTLSAMINGRVSEAIRTLRMSSPDLDYFEEQLRPVLIIRIPGYPNGRHVETMGDKLVFSGVGSNSDFIRFLVGYCELMNIKCTIV